MIYFLQEAGGDLAIKIGYTSNEVPTGRQKGCQTGNPREVIVLATMPGERPDETALHQQFASARLVGEWFRPVPELIQYIIAVHRPLTPVAISGSPSWPMTIYLAGKISKRDWRNSIIRDTDLPNIVFCPSNGLDAVPEWPILRYAIFSKHHYAGPFFAACDHGCFHGDDSHGLAAQEDDDRNRRPNLVMNRCFDAIEASDLVFAWIDQPDCYGTITELGFAAATKKKIYIGGPRHYRDMWFVYETATACNFNYPEPTSLLKWLLTVEEGLTFDPLRT